MRKLYFTIISLFIISSAFTQTKYSKAKIYTANNDVIDCLIRNTSTETTPQQFSYVINPGEAEKDISAADIQKIFYEDGTIYEKHVINVPVMNEPYINRKASQYEIRSNRYIGEAIVEKILAGKISLFLFKDRFNFPHYFYETLDENKFTELPYKTYVDENNQFHEDLSFKNELNFLIQKYNCTAISSNQLEQLRYTSNSMIVMFKKINSCAGSGGEVVGITKQKSKVHFGVMAGVAYNKLHIDILNPGYYPGLSESSFPASISPLAGGYVSLLPKKRVQNYRLTFEVYWQAFKSETDSIQANSYTKGKGSVQFSTVNFGPTIQYILSQSRIQPFLEAGVLVFSTMNLKDDYTYIASNTKYYRKIFDNAGPGMNAILGLGLQFDNFMIEGRYTPSLSQSHISGFSLLIKYDIAKK